MTLMFPSAWSSLRQEDVYNDLTMAGGTQGQESTYSRETISWQVVPASVL
jgi:hypothetical protein